MNLQILREERKAKGLTQEDMAKRLGYSGKSGYSLLEAGKVGVTIEMSLHIKNVLGLTDEKYQEIFLS